MARRRARWKAYQGKIAPQRLVFIDETWVKTNMAPLRGWGPRGKRLKAYAPYGHWKTLTFIAALRAIARSRRSIEYGTVIQAGLLPSPHGESDHP